MGSSSLYVSPVFHARGEIMQVNLCSPRVIKQEYAHVLSSSSPSLVFSSAPTLLLSSSNLMANSSTKIRRPNITLRRSSSIQSSASVTTTEPKSIDHGKLNVSERWREIQGENHWEGLLDHPIDAVLRAEIIRYGEFAQVSYDSFEFEKHSLYCGSCKYSRKTLFEKVDKGACGYEVTKYLYATSELDLPKFFIKSESEEDKRWSKDSNWIGYVAVCTDEAEIKRIGRRDILIAWRGTITKTEWIDDLRTTQIRADLEEHLQSAGEKHEDDHVKVESGFLSLYTSSKAGSRFNKLSAGQQMAVEVKRLLQKYEGEEVSISIVGHSLGGSLALLCAYDIAANMVAPLKKAAPSNNTLVTVFTFGGPRVGNKAFKERLEKLGVRVLRIVNVHDAVPKVPGVLFNESSVLSKVLPIASSYYHVGKELEIDMDVSPHLQESRDLGNNHNLEAYLHLVDGFHGITRPFQSVFNRNPLLVNKSSDFLKVDKLVPSSWWQDRNKGLAKDPSGQWVLSHREDEHFPEIHHP